MPSPNGSVGLAVAAGGFSVQVPQLFDVKPASVGLIVTICLLSEIPLAMISSGAPLKPRDLSQ